MIDELIQNIKDYIYYLKKRGLYISIHTSFVEYMLPLFEFNAHKNPICIQTKSENESWDKCIRDHGSHYFNGCTPVKKRTCYAGVTEYIFNLHPGGSVCVSPDDTTKESWNEEEMKVLLYPLCRMIEYLIMLCPKTETEISKNEMVNRMIKYIHRNFYNPIRNEDIAKYCSCSVSTVCHSFKKSTGKSIHRYILDLRLSYAKELLKTSHFPISSIAVKCGFSDYNYFTVTFKKEVGSTPTDYKNSP